MKLSRYVACICEGGAEKAIMELLLDAELLVFTRDDLLEGEILSCREMHFRLGSSHRLRTS